MLNITMSQFAGYMLVAAACGVVLHEVLSILLDAALGV